MSPFLHIPSPPPSPRSLSSSLLPRRLSSPINSSTEKSFRDALATHGEAILRVFRWVEQNEASLSLLRSVLIEVFDCPEALPDGCQLDSKTPLIVCKGCPPIRHRLHNRTLVEVERQLLNNTINVREMIERNHPKESSSFEGSDS